MRLFAVFQQGVYRHECGGIYDSETGAVAAADRLAASDVDDYHDYEVVPFELNADACEEDSVYTVKRNAALKKFGPHEGECTGLTDAFRSRHSLCSRGTKGCRADVRPRMEARR